MTGSSSAPTVSHLSVPAIDLSPTEATRLAGLLADLTGVAVSRSLSDGVLTRGTTDTPLTVTQALADEVATLAEQNVGRWRRLEAAVPFIVGLAGRLTDAHIEAGIAAAGLADNPDIVRLRQRASAHGGLAALVRARTGTLETEFPAELDRAIAVFRYVVRWPEGFHPEAPPADVGLPTTESGIGCAIGVAEVAVGGVAVGVGAAKTVASGGLAAPVGILTASVGVGEIGLGLITISQEC